MSKQTTYTVENRRWYWVILLFLLFVYGVFFLIDGEGKLRTSEWSLYGFVEFLLPLVTIVILLVSKWARERMYFFMMGFFYLAQLDLFYYAASTDLNVYSLLGLILSIYTFGMFFRTFKQFLSYAIFSWLGMMGVLWLAQSVPDSANKILLGVNLSGASVFNILITWWRFRLLRDEERSRLIFQAIFDSVDDVICIFEASTMELVEYNLKAQKSLGMRKNIKKDTASMKKLMKELSMAGVSEVREVLWDGVGKRPEWWGELTIIPVSTQEVELLVVKINDISTYKETEIRMRKMNKMMVGRELKIAELKKQVQKLKADKE